MPQPSGHPYPDEPHHSGPPQSGPPYPGQAQPGQAQPGQAPPESPRPGPPYPGQGSADVTAVFSAPGLIPGYPPTGYQQDGSAPPGYAQAGYLPVGGIGFPTAPTPPPAPRSKLVPIVLVSVAALLVLCVGGGTLVFFTLKNSGVDLSDAAGRPTGAPRTPEAPAPTATTPTPESTPTATVKLITPARLNGRKRVTNAETTKNTEALAKQLSRLPGATASIGAFYGSPARGNVVIVTAVALPVPDPETGLTAALGGGTGTLTNVVKVPAGPLGGKAKCGNNTTNGVRFAVCGWADGQSIGLLLWQSKTVEQAKKEFPKLRGQLEKVG